MYKTIKCNGLFCLSLLTICNMEFSLLYFELRIRYNHYSLQITLNHPSHIVDNLSLIGSANNSRA